MCGLFFIVKEIDFANYVDDNTPFVSGDTSDDVFESLGNTSSKLFEWFSNNQMKANPDKCHLLISAATSSTIKIKDNEIFNSDSEKQLAVTKDSKLIFNSRLEKALKRS